MEDLGPPLYKPASSFIMNKDCSSATDFYSYMIGFWNCEGISRNCLAIQYILGYTDIICLSEVNGSDSNINIVLKENHDINFVVQRK